MPPLDAAPTFPGKGRGATLATYPLLEVEFCFSDRALPDGAAEPSGNSWGGGRGGANGSPGHGTTASLSDSLPNYRTSSSASYGLHPAPTSARGYPHLSQKEFWEPGTKWSSSASPLGSARFCHVRGVLAEVTLLPTNRLDTTLSPSPPASSRPRSRDVLTTRLVGKRASAWSPSPPVPWVVPGRWGLAPATRGPARWGGANRHAGVSHGSLPPSRPRSRAPGSLLEPGPGHAGFLAEGGPRSWWSLPLLEVLGSASLAARARVQPRPRPADSPWLWVLTPDRVTR